jgi:hypothetical protein
MSAGAAFAVMTAHAPYPAQSASVLSVVTHVVDGVQAAAQAAVGAAQVVAMSAGAAGTAAEAGARAMAMARRSVIFSMVWGLWKRMGAVVGMRNVGSVAGVRFGTGVRLRLRE